MSKIPPKQAQVIQIITAYRQSAALSALLSTGLLKVLRKTKVIVISDYAQRKQFCPDKLRRLLEFCECYRLVRIESDYVHLDELGKHLVNKPYLYDWAECELQPTYWRAWASFKQGLSQNQTAFNIEFKTPFFEYINQSPKLLSLFQRTMMSQTTNMIPSIASSFPFRNFKRIVDIGGG